MTQAGRFSSSKMHDLRINAKRLNIKKYKLSPPKIDKKESRAALGFDFAPVKSCPGVVLPSSHF